jgi:hypothetical protein
MNVFSYSSRQHVCEHAFRTTLADLRARRAELAPVLAKHGLTLRDEVLDDPAASIMDGLGLSARSTETTARLRRALDDVDVIVKARKPARRRTATRRH